MKQHVMGESSCLAARVDVRDANGRGPSCKRRRRARAARAGRDADVRANKQLIDETRPKT